MRLPEGCGLAHGIYAVRLSADGAVRDGVASFGRRPTFDNGAPLLETFVFDFSGDLYGEDRGGSSSRASSAARSGSTRPRP